MNNLDLASAGAGARLRVPKGDHLGADEGLVCESMLPFLAHHRIRPATHRVPYSAVSVRSRPRDRRVLRAGTHA